MTKFVKFCRFSSIKIDNPKVKLPAFDIILSHRTILSVLLDEEKFTLL